MRYIKKKATPPDCITEYISECNSLGVPHPLLYKDFNRTKELNEVLSSEQHYICCYCQRAVKGFRIEHLYPEKGPDEKKSLELQLNYNNLFASCIDSQGKPQNLQFCDVAKGNSVIREFIKEKKCSSFFRYTLNGEIIPNGFYNTWKEYESLLSEDKDIQDAINCIKTLNLNCTTLIEYRKECIDVLIRFLSLKSLEEVQSVVNDWMSSDKYPSCFELRLQYIREKYPQIVFETE